MLRSLYDMVLVGAASKEVVATALNAAFLLRFASALREPFRARKRACCVEQKHYISSPRRPPTYIPGTICCLHTWYYILLLVGLASVGNGAITHVNHIVS